MTHVYINGELCDIEINKKDILFKRVLLDPTKLNTEDMQRSYQIQLPKSEKNNRIFGFRNVEEVKGKFNNAFPAEVYINDIRILEGHFVLSKITQDAYIGNVGVLYQKSIKDIFGDRAMNQAKDWIIDFGAFKESIEEYNTKEDTPACIFPAVLYGLLPKVKGSDAKEYTPKNVWDNSVRLGMDDLMPSVNCLQMIKNIFNKEGYSIGGSAFGDQRLNKLYVSYKNPVDYEPDWNYRKNGKIDIHVDWSLHLNRKNTAEEYVVERTTIPANNIYTTELLSTTNGKVTINSDDGHNVVKTLISGYDRGKYTRYGVIIPRSGIYKVNLSATIILDPSTDYSNSIHSYRDKDKVIRGYGANHYVSGRGTSLFDHSQYEIKVLRDRGEGDFNLENNRIDRSYFTPAINQTDKTTEEDYPKYYPEAGKTMFIDPEQNNKLVCGISFGMDANPVNEDGNAQNKKCNPIIIKGGLSWNNKNMDFTSAASGCDKYYKAYLAENDRVRYEKTDIYRVETNLPENYSETSVDKALGTGQATVLIYLEKGERLTLIDASLAYGNGTTRHITEARLTIEPYKKNEEWLSDQLEVSGKSNSKIIYNETQNDFLEKEINLTSFLPSDEKIDSWLDNFCKAFNLSLTQTGEKSFELNIKQARQASMLSVIDVHTYQEHRENSALNLPPEYIVRFTVDEEEEGYEQTKENGGGSYATGAETGNNIEQYSNFSYCWYKQLYEMDPDTYLKKELVILPVISDREVWQLEDDMRDYEEMQQKWYVNKRQRLWYRDSVIELPGLGESDTLLCTVRNELPAHSILDYYDKSLSILDNFFTLFINSDNCYTEIDCFLTPEEYRRLPYSMVRFNGDLYYPAEVNNYDPSGRKMATLKLIRKL